ncbi:MAG: beta-galactosidase [Bacteroidota bacterium]
MMQKISILFIAFCLSISLSAQETVKSHYVKIVKPEYSKSNTIFKMGTAVNPAGKSITINSQSMLINGKPVVPVMGEIHFSRVPENEWEKELLKMKAGGITIVSTYIFWIHHEEVEGKYDWTGQRNLKKFIETCTKLDLPLVLRIGPWAHGECRNGGFPEWMVNSGIKLRNDNPAYLDKVRPWFDQIFKQVHGSLWKSGGSIIGIQLENEYGGRWEHLVTLKNMVKEIGFDVPFYTRTGWPKLASPATFGEILPLYGDYADGFWDRSLKEMPGDYSKGYLFRAFRSSTVIATEQLPKQSDKDNPQDFGYPYFTCELGGGMMPSYHRRINIAPMDVYTMAMVKVGSGSNLPGYYMYHGGTNPDGALTTLNEEQATNFTNHNDLPVKTYDFQAPLGEFGQVNPQYHLLRRMHLFLQDFGDGLALMPPSFPDSVETPNNINSLRWNVRSDGHSGYVFVNNYQRLKNTGTKENVSFTIDLPEEKLLFPKAPITIPANSSFFMPFNLKLGAATLNYATAQPIAKIMEGNTLTVFFAKNTEESSEFAFDAKGIKLEFSNGIVQKQGESILISKLQTGMAAAFRLRDENNLSIQIVLLDEKTSLNLWKGQLAGKERIFITNSELTFNGNELELTDTNNKMEIGIYPSLQKSSSGKLKMAEKKEGLFTVYTITTPKPAPLKLSLTKVADAGTLREIKMGKQKVAESPKDSSFSEAGVWKMMLPQNSDRNRDVYLKLLYTGDVARAYANNHLLTDNFYNGKPFEIGLKRFSDEVYSKGITLKILPFQKDAPIYLQENARLDFSGMNSILSLPNFELYEKYQVKLVVQ